MVKPCCVHTNKMLIFYDIFTYKKYWIIPKEKEKKTSDNIHTKEVGIFFLFWKKNAQKHMHVYQYLVYTYASISFKTY